MATADRATGNPHAQSEKNETAAAATTQPNRKPNSCADLFMNAQPPEATIGERINGFAWIPFALAAGAAGKGDLQLIARTADPSFHKCGYEEVRGVENDATVSISANSSCGKPARTVIHSAP
jgi:hypothetical protein